MRRRVFWAARVPAAATGSAWLHVDSIFPVGREVGVDGGDEPVRHCAKCRMNVFSACRLPPPPPPSSAPQSSHLGYQRRGGCARLDERMDCAAMSARAWGLLLSLSGFLACTGTAASPDAGTGGGGGDSDAGLHDGGAGGGGGADGGVGGGAGGGVGGGSNGGGSGGGAGGGTGGGGASLDGGVPSWRRGLVAWEWVELPGTSLSTLAVENPLTGAMERPTARIDAWNGLAADPGTNRVYLACAGGHADWAGNEVYDIDLGVDAPRWRMLRGPTPGASIVVNQPYYLDGRPSSTHLYYALHVVPSRGRIFKFSAGSVWGDGNSNNNNVDAFDLAAGDWDAMGTWAAASTQGNAIDRPYAQDPTTGDVYTFLAGAFRKWTAATATWTSLAPRPSYANDDIVDASGAVVDPVRQRVVFLRNLYRVPVRQGLQLTFSGALSDIPFTGPAVDSLIEAALGAQFLPGENVLLVKTSTGGEVLRVDGTYVTTVQPTTGPTPPDAVNGVYTRWLYLPRLGGVAYLPSGSANFWFLATQ
ncbi:MAG: hypothetical protein AB1938_03830 [Myxococcota bacterium]